MPFTKQSQVPVIVNIISKTYAQQILSELYKFLIFINFKNNIWFFLINE